MIHILQLSDTHLFADPEGSLYDINTRDMLDRVITHVRQNFNEIDAILLTGDLVHDETSEGYQVLKSMITRLNAPAYYLPGNHDDPEIMDQVLGNCANDRVLSFGLGDWSIMLLDSSVEGKVEGALSDSTLTELEQLLKDSRDSHVLVALHHHIIDVHSPWLDALNLRNHSQLTTLLVQYPNVRAVINGHVHQEIDAHKNGIRFLGTPATCFQFAVRSTNGGMDDRPPGYRHIVLKDDGSIDTTVHYVP